MKLPSCLTDQAKALVLDASAVINLIASGRAADILRALPWRSVTLETVRMELEKGRERGRTDADALGKLIVDQALDLVELSEPALTCFESLVLGSAVQTLDDGEAATIAFALEHEAVAVVDDQKAIRICGERYPKLKLVNTVDLLAHPNVVAALGRVNLSLAVQSALKMARMRVLLPQVCWVVEMIGRDQAALYPSLPRSARISGAWGH